MINDPDHDTTPGNLLVTPQELGAIHVVPQLAHITVSFDDGGTEPLELPPGAHRVTFAILDKPNGDAIRAVVAATWGPASEALLAQRPLALQEAMPWTPGAVAPRGEPPVRVFFADGTALDLPGATPCFWCPVEVDALFGLDCPDCEEAINSLAQRCGCEGRIWCLGCSMPIKAPDSSAPGPGCGCTLPLYPGQVEFLDADRSAGMVNFTLPNMAEPFEQPVSRLSEADGGTMYVLVPGHGGKWRRARREAFNEEAARLWARIEREANTRARQPYPPIRVLYADGALEFADLDAMTRCVPHGGHITRMTAEELAAAPTSIEVELTGDDGGALATYPAGAPFQVDQRVAVLGEYVVAHNALIYVEQPATAPGQAERWRLATTEPLLDTVRRLHAERRPAPTVTPESLAQELLALAQKAELTAPLAVGTEGSFAGGTRRRRDHLEAARALLARYNITPKESEDR